MFLKDPGDVKDISIDFTGPLATGDTLTGSATITPDTGITVDSDAVATPLVTIRLSGGTAGERYDVNCEISTTDGETFNRKVVIVCEDL
jgi:hypothetical protein